MAVQHLSAPCPECGFPISGKPGDIKNCPNCGISGKITGVTIPDALFWGTIGLIAGIIIARSKIIGAKLSTL